MDLNDECANICLNCVLYYSDRTALTFFEEDGKNDANKMVLTYYVIIQRNKDIKMTKDFTLHMVTYR